MRRSCLTFAVLLLTTPCFLSAQAGAGAARNSIYLELLGNGGLYSLNFDHLVSRQVSLRAGLANWTSEGSLFGPPVKTSVTALPLMANYLAGRGRGRFEAGAGVLVGRKKEESSGFSEGTQSSSFVTLTATVGYRSQPLNRGIVFRIGFTPFFGLDSEADAYPGRGFLPSVGLSVGYGF